MSLLNVIHKHGEVKKDGCVLKVEGNRYCMYQEKDIDKKLYFAIEKTGEARLTVSWAGFVAGCQQPRKNAASGFEPSW